MACFLDICRTKGQKEEFCPNHLAFWPCRRAFSNRVQSLCVIRQSPTLPPSSSSVKSSCTSLMERERVFSRDWRICACVARNSGSSEQQKHKTEAWSDRDKHLTLLKTKNQFHPNTVSCSIVSIYDIRRDALFFVFLKREPILAIVLVIAFLLLAYLISAHHRVYEPHPLPATQISLRLCGGLKYWIWCEKIKGSYHLVEEKLAGWEWVESLLSTTSP